MRALHDIYAFVDNSEFRNHVMWFFASLLTAVQIALSQILLHEGFLVLLGLVLIDTLMGAIQAAREGRFSVKILIAGLGMKVMQYGVYTAICLLIALAPSKMLVAPVVSVVFTYMIIREAASSMRSTSKVFHNTSMDSVHQIIDNAGDRVLGRFRRP